MTVDYAEEPLLYHAVARQADGTLNDTADCGRPVPARQAELEPIPWDEPNSLMLCQVCVETAGRELKTQFGRMLPDGRIVPDKFYTTR